MAIELATALEGDTFPRQRRIHDCVDTGATLALTLSTEIPFPVDCVGRDYVNPVGGELWDPLTSKFTDSIDNALIFAKIKATLNGPKDAECHVRIYVPHPTFGDILVDEKSWILHKNGIDTSFEWTTGVYTGTDADAKTYGFYVTIEPSANMDLKARSILVAT